MVRKVFYSFQYRPDNCVRPKFGKWVSSKAMSPFRTTIGRKLQKVAMTLLKNGLLNRCQAKVAQSFLSGQKLPVENGLIMRS